jgi:hypothetical protein
MAPSLKVPMRIAIVVYYETIYDWSDCFFISDCLPEHSNIVAPNGEV